MEARRGISTGLLWLGFLGCSSDKPGGGPGGDDGARSWTMADLGPGRCVAGNRHGDVLGSDADGQPFVVHPDRTRTALGGFAAGATTVGVAISARGEVVGYSDGPSGRTAIHTVDGQWVAIAGLSGTWSAAAGLDEDDRIVGVMGDGQVERHAFVVDRGGSVALPLPAGLASAGYVAGSSARVAGIVETAAGDTHAFVIADGELRDLGTLGGEASAPLGINARGDVVGAAETAAGARHAFVAALGGAMVDLGVPAGAVSSEARGIDDHGRIVGNVYDASGMARPVAFVPGADPIALLPADETTNPFVSAAVAAMSSDGGIAGWGVARDPRSGVVHCLRWTPGA